MRRRPPNSTLSSSSAAEEWYKRQVGNVELTHILSGQGIGASLTGKAIRSHWATSVDGSKLTSGGGVYILNDRGLPIGGCVAVNPSNLQPKPNSMGAASLGLNFVARVSTSS